MPLSYEANEDRGVQAPRHNPQNQRPPKALHTCPCSPNTDICPGTRLNSRVHDSGQWSLACSRSNRTEGAHRVPNRRDASPQHRAASYLNAKTYVMQLNVNSSRTSPTQQCLAERLQSFANWRTQAR